MKKVVGLLIILILAGAAFFFGWAQLPVPPGSYGVIRSKTHGVDTILIREGEFRWIWYKLIPTNTVTLVFTLNPVSRTISADGNLPSAETYAAAAGINADFSYELGALISFTLRAASLPSLVREKGLDGQESLENYENELAEKLDFFVLERLEAYALDLKFTQGPVKTAAAARLETEILQAFPDIENFSCTVQNIKLPDLALYNTARSIYEEYLDKQKEFLKTEMAGQAERSVNSLFRFDELEKYGELLTKYPVLLQYLALPRP
ncbi:hypothetical protein [Treponema primitia]|uniref:hypothetical protein n=1 Tax=Treponema primitia TaxID=88058 RepID=UPI00025556B8|nr:hypothetical protein [Treponema primitia]